MAETKGYAEDLDGWIRRRLRCIIWRQWKRYQTRYRQLCKRPCFHDEYLQAFNEPSAVLLDTDGQGVQQITESGVVVAGVEHEVDCIIYATGFEVGTELKRRTGFEVIGRALGAPSRLWVIDTLTNIPSSGSS